MQPETDHPLDALIIGGGISGLACLWRLRRLGLRAVCVEATGRVGGSIRSHRGDAFLVEGGATSVQPSPELLELVREIGLEGEIVRVPERLPRFVYRHGRLHAVPFGAAGLLTTSLLSGVGKCRLLAELWVAPRRDGAEESVEAFVARRFGREAAAAIAAPFVSGTFAGDVARLSASGIFPTLVELERAYGGVIRGLLARRGRGNGESLAAKGAMISFREGLETLPLRLHERLGDAVELGVRAEQIERRESFQVSLYDGRGARAVTARAVVLATSPVAAASVLDSLVPDASRAIAELEAPPVACVSLAWRRSQVDHSLVGFGFLTAPGEATRILGCFWPASVFPDRAPPDQAVLTSFVGGARDHEAAMLDEPALVDVVARDLGRVVGATGSPLVLAVDRHATAIPQYTIGHHDRLQRVRAGLTAAPGLFVAGNFFAGIGVGECVRQATNTAKDVADFLQSKRAAGRVVLKT
jgi:protoporphyrinogen/coproporphyrinogen III oxidase